MTDLERIARLLCHSDGFDPDELVYELRPDQMAVGAKGLCMCPRTAPHPQWTIYEHYVKGTLDAILAGSEGADLREIIQHVISGEEIPLELSDDDILPEGPPFEEELQPPRTWREVYGLNK